MMIQGTVQIRGESYPFWREHSFGEQHYVASGQLLVCPVCRLIWAVIAYQDQPETWPIAAFCEEHRPSSSEWYPVPGSILFEEGWGLIDDELLGALSPELVQREFNLHLKAYS